LRTNIDIDDALLNEAMELTGLATKKATVEEGLRRIVAAHRRLQSLKDAYGKYPDWGDDYKPMRANPHPGE
jgi:Arc/MetJ family transcription regulator